jgi:transposase
MRPDGQKLATARIDNDPAELRKQIARAGECPRVVLEAAYGWYWAVDALEAAGAEVHLAHPLGVKGFACRRVKNDLLTELREGLGQVSGRMGARVATVADRDRRRGSAAGSVAAGGAAARVA